MGEELERFEVVVVESLLMDTIIIEELVVSLVMMILLGQVLPDFLRHQVLQLLSNLHTGIIKAIQSKILMPSKEVVIVIVI